MEMKPIHFDGSMHPEGNGENQPLSQPFTLTDEARLNIGKNPYSLDQGE
ncbi:hypothetical protein [Neobacillus piezotolerans]|nr:hypothetical protein [Neobacillus piezotolerans]